ncbi:MAG: alkaline phosphatase family protein [Phycisphaerae bacterium]|nr:alkaline phosphatase family protein [Phycisphaerae bacterium]
MTETPASKVLLIGWDGADWKVITPLLDAGKLPHLERFVNEGVIGNLATLYPSLSPMLWTSIATGKRPFKHGVLGFTEPDPNRGGVRPITILSRKTKAVWNILCQDGKTCNVVGWWPSHPAEPLRGVMVSNHYHRAVGPLGKPWPVRPGTIHPERLVPNLADLRVHPHELTADQLLPFIPRAAEIDQAKDPRLAILAKILAECATVHAAATALIQLEPWDFMAVYYDAIDHFSHGFMRYHPPRQPWVPEKDYELYKDVVEGGYRFHDMMLGILLKLAGPDTTVLLVSDHGFHPDHLRPRHVPREPAGPATQHRHYGIFAMRGPGVKKDERVHGATLLDVTPTILTLFGLPVGQDMDGKPLVSAFAEPTPVQTVPSWDDVAGDAGTHPPEKQLDPVEAQEALDQLVALGYIEPPGANRQKAAAASLRELNYNLARSYMDAGRHADAIPLLERLYAEQPDSYRFGIQLVLCCQVQRRLGDARRVLDDLFRRKTANAEKAAARLKEFADQHKDAKPEDFTEKQRKELSDLQAEATANPFTIHYLMALLCSAEGKEDEALQHIAIARKAAPREPALYRLAGDILLKLKRWEDAERSFAGALASDPDDAAARLGLCRTFLARRRNQEAAGEALAAVGLLYFNPQGHYLLGVALHRLGYIPRAVEALKVAVAQNPRFADAHARLAQIYDRRLKNPTRAAEHRRLAEVSRRPGKQSSPASALPDIEAPVPPLPPSRLPPLSSSSALIISGLPRSGTSMMMQMLKAGGMTILADDARAADEDNPRGYFEFAKARALRRDRAWLEDARGKAVKIVAPLLPSLPLGLDGRIIFMERELSEVVASQKSMLAHRGRQGSKLPDAELARVLASQVRQVKLVLATREIPTLFVSYHDALADPASVAARVNAFLGGALNEPAMAAAVDPSLHHRRS